MPQNSRQSELFAGAQAPDQRPLAARMAPESLDEFCGQEKILGPGRMLRRLVESGKFSSAIFFGPPGCGKTALAAIVSKSINAKVESINAVAAGVADIKKALEAARYDLSQGHPTLLVVDEIHHFNRTQQDALLPSVERGEIMMIGLTTENPSFSVNAALLSRVTAFEFEPLSEDNLNGLVGRALKDETRGLGALKAELSPEAAKHLIRFSGGDARRLLNSLELAVISTAPVDGRRRVGLEVAEESIQRRQIRYDKKSDDHYDHISAFIKSMRGSNPDAALYWMAKMLTAGEDPRFIARRTLICAAEDVGLADFRALVIADAAFRAVEALGMPEARIPLAQAVIYIAAAPKSNSAYLAIDAALSEVKKGVRREVPLHLRDANSDAESRGHGAGYKYPHNFPGHYVAQDYMPEPTRFYEAGNFGGEAEIKKRLESLDAATLRENQKENRHGKN